MHVNCFLVLAFRAFRHIQLDVLCFLSYTTFSIYNVYGSEAATVIASVFAPCLCPLSSSLASTAVCFFSLLRTNIFLVPTKIFYQEFPISRPQFFEKSSDPDHMICTAHVTGQETSAQIFYKKLKFNSIIHTGRLTRKTHERDARWSLTPDHPCSCLLARQMRDNGG